MNAEPSGNGRPALSVLVALHQSADHLRTALAALSAQDVPDAEFVFCDDASTDGTADMIRPQLEECGLSDRARVMRHEVNRGAGKTRQELLSAARGEYVVFMDPDDRIDPGMYSGLLAMARKEDADVVWEGYFTVTGDEVVRHEERLDAATAAEMRRAILRGDIHGSVCNKVFRLDFIRRAGVHFREETTCCIDLDFMADLLLANPRIAYNPGCHYRYVLRRGSLSHGAMLPHLPSFVRLAGRLEEHVADAADAAAVQAFKARFRYYAAMDFSVPDAVFAGYLPETRRLYGGFSSLQRVLFWLCVHGLRPFVRLAWRLRHPMTGYGHG